MGLSMDKKLVLAKTMDGELIGVPNNADNMDISWKAKLKLPYELAPTAIYSNSKYIFVPTDKGLLTAVDPKSGETAWQYKISNGMINPPLVLKDRVVVSTMDGKIVMLTY
jgi:outer membrane protein assembly factor BamB